MKALLLRQLKTPLEFTSQPDPELGEDEALVGIQAAALNRRDYWIVQGMYPGIQLPAILGSDGAGVVTRVGERVPKHWLDQEVILNPGLDWGPDQNKQAKDFQILGMPRPGTFATEVAVPATALYPKPDHLDWTEAAALPLSGVTAYRALFSQGQLRPGEKVLVTGVGGGVATFALLFAKAAGGQVVVTSSSAEKRQRALELGAVAAFDYRAENWAKRLQSEQGSMDLIIDSAGGPGYNCLLDLAAPAGRIVNYGATAGPAKQLDLFKVFWKQLQILGTTMGSPGDFHGMLELVKQHKIHPVVDSVFSLSAGNDALTRLDASEQFGNLVLQV